MKISRVSRKVVSLAIICAVWMAIATPAMAQNTDYQEEGSTASRAGLGVASFLATIPYGVTKVAFAAGGGIVGGLAYVFTGGDTATAKNIWTTSIYGTYVITPDHLQGDKAVRFLGVAEEDTSGTYIEETRY